MVQNNLRVFVETRNGIDFVVEHYTDEYNRRCKKYYEVEY